MKIRTTTEKLGKLKDGQGADQSVFLLQCKQGDDVSKKERMEARPKERSGRRRRTVGARFALINQK
jgi:hypothetical protein